MGVYIKGMEMPKSCYLCPVRNQSYCGDGMKCSATGETKSWHDGQFQRGDRCPLVPVPPHGRLIDADALADSFDPSDFWNPDAEGNCFAAIHVVNCAPTIIPAEEGEP